MSVLDLCLIKVYFYNDCFCGSVKLVYEGDKLWGV